MLNIRAPKAGLQTDMTSPSINVGSIESLGILNVANNNICAKTYSTNSAAKPKIALTALFIHFRALFMVIVI
jgi:hypothetical protein